MNEHGRSVEPPVTETSSRENGGLESEELPESGQKSVKCSIRKKKSLRARYAYGVIFLLTNIIAWLFRDYGERILPMLPCECFSVFSVSFILDWWWIGSLFEQNWFILSISFFNWDNLSLDMCKRILCLLFSFPTLSDEIWLYLEIIDLTS